MPGKKEKGFRHIENKKKMAVIYLILRSLVIVVMIAQFYNRDYQNVFLCILTLILFMMPSIIERRFRIDLPDTLEIIILLLFSRQRFWVKSARIINIFLIGIRCYIR